MNLIKKNISIILIGLIFSFLFSIYSINKFDIYEISTDEKHYHSMIKGVNANHWFKAKKIKDQLSQGINYLKLRKFMTQLPSLKIVLLYSYLTGDDLIESQNNKKLKQIKIILLIFQSVFYSLSLFFFSLKLLD